MARQRRALLGTLVLGHLCNDWVAGTLWLLAPAIAASMGLGPIEVGIILTVNGIGAGLAYLPAGLIADRASRPGLLMLLSFWWVAIGYFSATLAPGFWAVTLLLAFGVMGDAFWHPVATGVLVGEMPTRRAQALGIHAVGGSIGAEVLAPLSTGFLLGITDWQTTLQILVLPALLMGIGFAPFASRLRRTRRPSPGRVDIRGLLRRWRRPAGLALLSMMVLYNMALMAQLAMAPLYFQQQHGLSPFHAGLIFAAMLLLGTAFQPWVGRYSDLRERKPVILLTLFGGAFFALFAGLADNLVWALAGLAPGIALLTAVRPVVLATAVEYSGEAESTTLGIVFTILDGVGMFGALLAGIAGEIALHHAFLMAAAMAAAAGLICLPLGLSRAPLGEPAMMAPLTDPAEPRNLAPGRDN